MKIISVLGSTGSIGTQTLSVVCETPGVKVAALSANENIDMLERQIKEFEPDFAAVADAEKALVLKKRLSSLKTEISGGKEAVMAAAAYPSASLVVNGIVGIAGLTPTVAAIKAKKNVALANKETLVAAGETIMRLAAENGVSILPVDGEHSAVFQCLRGNENNRISKIYLTASGGPFRNYIREQLESVTPDDALKHPTWRMGAKITVDCATLMNKGLEVIEACRLFGLPAEKIVPVIHPQSVIHSMVEFEDGAVIAQLSSPDMRLPIQYAINYPDRLSNSFPKLDLLKTAALTFEAPRMDLFPCLKYAFDALDAGGLMPAVLNAADEAAVFLFLNRKIMFTDIPILIENAMTAYTLGKAPETGDEIENILAAGKWAREYVLGASEAKGE